MARAFTSGSSPPQVINVVRSLVQQWWSSRAWNLRSSGFCSVVFGAPSLSLLTSAGAAVPLTFVATTGQLVCGQGCWDVEGSRWRVQQLASAESQGRGSQSMSAWLISISFRQGGLMTGRLRLWQTDFLCSMARNSQWTQP